MINLKVLEELEQVDNLIKEELKQFSNAFPSEKDSLRKARGKVQEAISAILKVR